jgi:hypothetical protein
MGSLGTLTFKRHPKISESTFFSKELIYEYVNGQVNSDRKKQIEEALEKVPSLQLELKRIQSAKQFLISMRHFEVPVAISERVEEPSAAWIRSHKWLDLSHLPEGLQQAVFALGLVSVLLCILLLVPWHKLKNLSVSKESHEILVMDRGRSKSQMDLAEAEKNEKPLFQDEKTEVKNFETNLPARAEGTEYKKDREMGASNEAVTMGFLYRGQMKITNLQVNGKRLTEKIRELGGRKAGEVDLGWNKGPKTIYYHFTIPESRYDELKSFLSLYGQPKINKEKHPRIMPEGIIRLILTIDEERQ